MNIYAKITENNEHGDYVTPDGTRVILEWGHLIKSPTGETPEQLGYTEFSSVEEAVACWGLTEYHPSTETE